MLYKDVAAVLQITFNAINSDNSNWFSISRLIDSPWTDLESESKAVFAIRGWKGRRRERRSFHISKTFNSCTEDEGWLVVTDAKSCTWEQRKGRGAVVYSNIHHYTNWNSPSKPGKLRLIRSGLFLLTVGGGWERKKSKRGRRWGRSKIKQPCLP